jgi:hypothetical protein
MSRISRYQESIEKFIKNKNINTYFSDEYNDLISNKLMKSDHLGGIILSTIFNHNSKKSNVKGHGYFLGIAIDILLIMLDSKNTNLYFNQNLLIGIYKLLNENINIIKINNQEELNNILLKTYEYFNNHIYNIIVFPKKMQVKKMIKSDLLNLKTINDQLYKKISQMNRYAQEDMIEYIKISYGGIGKLILVLSWILGGGSLDKKIINSLELIGEKFGMIYKLSYDFDNIINDINSCDQVNLANQSNNITRNVVINIGIQESFALFMEFKSSFYEEAFKLGIYTHTMKEVIDELEVKMDKCIENSKVDMKSTYSSFSTIQ